MYATFNTKNGEIGYLFLNVQLYTAKELEILQEYIDLKDIFNKKAI